MSEKRNKKGQLSLDFNYSPEPKEPSAEHDQEHEAQTDRTLQDELEASVRKTNEMMQSQDAPDEASDEVAYGEHPPLPANKPMPPDLMQRARSHGTDMVERDLAYRLASDPKACATHIEEGLHKLANEPTENNRLALRRRLRDVARAWDIPVSGRD